MQRQTNLQYHTYTTFSGILFYESTESWHELKFEMRNRLNVDDDSSSVNRI